MEWEKAKLIIQEKIKVGTEINTLRPDRTRPIINVNDSGIRVKIGQKVKINISWTMLEDCFNQLSTEEGYNTKFFEANYPTEINRHGCYAHSIGQIFVKSGIAETDDNKKSPSYFIKNEDENKENQKGI